jgi:outer membrane protein assembly factor BamB
MRRLLVLGLALLLLAGCKGSGKRDNVEPPAELTDFAASASVQSLWTNGVGEGEKRLGVRQHPVVFEGRLYSADVEGRVVALDASSGRQLWQTDTDLRLTGGPGIGDGTLVVGSLDGDVVALNPETGTERWRSRVSSEVISTPAVGGGIAVVRSNDGRLFGFSITDGERRWVYDRGLPTLTLRGNGAPIIHQGAVFIGYDNGQVVALRLEDGIQAWEQSVAVGEGRTEIDRMTDVDGEMVIDGAIAYAAAYKGQVLAISIDSGRPLWNRELSSYSGIAAAGDRLLVSDDRGTVWALDRATGSALWKQDVLAHRWLTTPAVQGDYAVVGDIEGYLHWLKLEDGALASRERLGNDPIRATPQVSDNVLYAVTTHGKHGAFRLQ